MTNDPNDSRISVVEDLDPEPAPRNKRAPVNGWEMLLGLVVLLGVLGWVGWQWWNQSSMESDYRLGQEAEASQDWDEARASYLAAGNYRDSPTHASNALTLITERNREYDLAVEHATKHEWTQALEAVQAVERIQKNYRDSAAIEAVARSYIQPQVYAEALYGAIALRTEAQPPGLYYRGGDGWIWLDKSDKWSRVLGSGRLDYVLYDVPGPGWMPPTGLPPTPAPFRYPPTPGSPELKGRRLMIAWLGGKAPLYNSLNLDPSQYNYYLYGNRGIWGCRFNLTGISATTTVDPATYSWLMGYDITYQPFITASVTPVTFPNQNWRVMSSDDWNDRLLLAERQTGDATGGPVNLYTADADGSNRRLVYSIDGQSQGNPLQHAVLFSAQVSPDGHSLLVVWGRPADNRGAQWQEVAVVDIATGTKRALSQKQVTSPEQEHNAQPELAATYLHKGGMSGRVLVIDRGAAQTGISLFDPNYPFNPLAATSVQSPANVQVAVDEDEDTGSLLVSLLRDANSVSGIATVVQIAPGKPFASGALPPLGAQNSLTGPFIHDLQLVYSYRVVAYTPGQTTTSVLYSLPLSGLGNPDAQPTELYSIISPGAGISQGSRWYLGSRRFAYLTDGELHVRGYDGAGDLLLETGVGALYDVQEHSGETILP